MSDEHHDIVHYEDSGIPQPWHLVRPSIWPLLAAMAAGFLMAMTVMFMHKDKLKIGSFSLDLGLSGVYVGLGAVIIVAALWWRDIIREAFVEKAHSQPVKHGLH